MLKRKILLVFALVLLVCCSAFAQKKYNSLFWEISGNGLRKPSYLYGTMHVSHKIAFHLSDSFFLALQSVDMVALESNPEIWLKEFMESDLIRGLGSYMSGIFGSGERDLYRKAFLLNRPEGSDFSTLLQSEPWIVNGLLYRSTDNQENFEEDTYLDLFIYQSGKKLGKKIASLEDFKTSMEMAEKARIPDKKDVKGSDLFKKRMEMYESGVNFAEKIEDAYRRGDLDLLDSLDRMMNPSQNYQKWLIDERNIIMAHNMDSLMKHHSLFSGIGAAHLPGRNGVIELLRKMGYTVRPVIFSAAKDSRFMAKIDRIKVPLNWKKQFPADSLFSVMMPGDMHEIASSGLTRQYLYSDMGNGSYYVVTRMLTFSAWSGRNEESVLAGIDSLLFENIPGRILVKKRILHQGKYPGFSILNKTRRGDIQQYRILVTPSEILVFKLAGRGEYAKGKETESFFSSIHLPDREVSLRKFSDPASGFSVMFPPVFRLGNDFGEKTKKYAAQTADGKNILFLMKHTYDDFEFIEQDSFELYYLAENFMKEMKFEPAGALIPGGGELPSVRFTAKKGGLFLHGEFILRVSDYFLVGCVGAEEKFPVETFSTLSLFPPKSSRKDSLYTDSTLLFSVKSTLGRGRQTSDLLRDMLSFYNDERRSEFEFTGSTSEEVYSDPETGESVKVHMEIMHKYFFEDTLASFWKQEGEEYTGSGFMKFRILKEDRGVDMKTLDALVTADASTRGLRIRKILHRGALWTLTAVSDSAGNMGTFSGNFFSTFRLLDTVIGRNIDQDKVLLLLDHLSGNDSADKLHASHAVAYVAYQVRDEHFGKWSSFVSSPVYANLPPEKRAEVIIAFGRMKRNRIAQLMEKLYSAAGDTSILQFAALQALTMHGSKESTDMFIRLILENTPLAADESDYRVSQVFLPLYDRADQAARLWPQLFRLLRFREYEDAVYGLLSYLVREKKISLAQIPAAEKDMIIRLATDELKRQGSFEEPDRNYISEITNIGIKNGDALYYGNNTLFRFANILTLYRTEPAVKNFYSRLDRSSDKYLRVAIAARFMKLGLLAHDSLWTAFAKDPYSRIPALCWLTELGMDAKYPSEYRTQEKLAEGSVYEYLSPGTSDSLFYDTLLISSGRYGRVSLHIYRYKPKSSEDWEWYAMAQGGKGETGYPETWVIPIGELSLEDQKDKQEIYDQFRQSCRLTGRLRVSPNSNDYFSVPPPPPYPGGED